MDKYIENRISFLSRIGTDKYLPERDRLELTDNDTINFNMAFADYISCRQIRIPAILEANIYFMVFDSYFESKNPSLEGLSFRKKYLSLPQNNNLDKIIASIYRILKVYRNAMVHNMTSIKIDVDSIKINYQFNGTNYILTITNEGMSILKGFVLCFFHYFESVFSDSYLELLFNGYYYDILNEIKIFNDEDGNNLLSFPNFICRHFRHDCDTIKYTKCDDVLIFSIPDTINNYTNYPIDIRFAYDNKNYILPCEILAGTKKININDINLWETKTILMGP